MSELFEFSSPTHVTVGAIGPPGQRVFYLQAREGGLLVTVKVEKQQVDALSSHLGELLQGLARPGHLPSDDELELEAFGEATFVVGAIGVAYDADADRLILLAEEREDREEDEPKEARLVAHS